MKRVWLLLLLAGCAQGNISPQTCATLDANVRQLTLISSDTYVYGFADGEDNAHEDDMGVMEGFNVHCSTSDPLKPVDVSTMGCLEMTYTLGQYTDGIYNSTLTYHP